MFGSLTRGVAIICVQTRNDSQILMRNSENLGSLEIISRWLCWEKVTLGCKLLELSSINLS